ncbi:hypothetical protein D3C81_2021390 [compost metagenome]
MRQGQHHGRVVVAARGTFFHGGARRILAIANWRIDGRHGRELFLQVLEQGPDFLGQHVGVACTQADRVRAGLHNRPGLGRHLKAVRVAIERWAGVDAERDLGGVFPGRSDGQ